MITTAFVKIWGRVAGAVAWNEKTGTGSFEYEPSFTRLGWDLSPLKMPLSTAPRVFRFPELRAPRDAEFDTFKGLPGLLADVLPDRYGNQLLDAWLAREGRAAGGMNPVEQLCFIGTRGMGALEFEPSRFNPVPRTFRVEMDGLVDIARQMLHNRTYFASNLNKGEEQAMSDILKIGTSAGGARPKAIIAFNAKTGEVRSGQAKAPKGFEHWLIKLDGVSDAQFGQSTGYGRVEMAYSLMARDCGIEMMECRLLEENGRAHFMTRRFDREGGDAKHHIQTWCGMEHLDFNLVTSFSYEQLFRTMRLLRLPYPQADQMFRRMAFNVLAWNCDDHTKNFAFRLPEGKPWELAPAYDLCFAYHPKSWWVSQHALSVNGKRSSITEADLLAVAKAMNIKKGPTVVAQIREVVGRWGAYAETTGVAPELRDRIGGQLQAH